MGGRLYVFTILLRDNVLRFQNIRVHCIEENFVKQWYFATKIVLTYCEQNCSSDREKPLKFKTEGQDFKKSLRSLEQFIQTVKGQHVFFNLFLEVSQI